MMKVYCMNWAEPSLAMIAMGIPPEIRVLRLMVVDSDSGLWWRSVGTANHCDIQNTELIRLKERNCWESLLRLIIEQNGAGAVQ